MRKRWISTLVVALLVLVTMGVAWAQTSPGFDLNWHVLSGGGREGMASKSYMVNGTLGQLAIGPAARNNYGVGSGYWYGARFAVVPPTFDLYLPMILKSAVP